eukprot:COSAG05_NODE_1080_length_5950_cov_1.563323_6_plen_80_part_00
MGLVPLYDTFRTWSFSPVIYTRHFGLRVWTRHIGVAGNHMGPYGAIWGHMGAIWGPYGGYMRPYGGGHGRTRVNTDGIS